ncbi:MAG: DUF4440 domain-containing protein [Ilumatobacteraceae bacterium]
MTPHEQPPPTPDLERVEQSERDLLTTDVRADPDRLEQLLHPDFVEIGQSGRRWTRTEMITALLDSPDPGDVEIDDVHTTMITADVALITYTTRRPTSTVQRSSLWVRHDDRWTVRFHQGTPIPHDTGHTAPVAPIALLLTGTSAAGKSAVAGEVYEQLVRAGPGSAWIDLDAIAHCDTDDNHGGFFGSEIMAENLASIWPNYRRRGIDKLILSRAIPNAVELTRIRTALPDVAITVCLLTASATTLERRLHDRDLGELAGRRIGAAVALQDQMTRSGIADLHIDNDDSDLTTIAAQILQHWAPHDRPTR